MFGTNYTTQKATDTVTISYAQIGRIILDNSDTTGVNDYDNLTINDGTDNIICAVDNLPVVGAVTLT